MADEAYEGWIKNRKATDFPSFAKEKVALYIRKMNARDHEINTEFMNDPDASTKLHGHIDYIDDVYEDFTADKVYVVWFCYILGNWKALCSTTVEDGKYYEVTFNADKGVYYVDEYVKKHQMIFNIL